MTEQITMEDMIFEQLDTYLVDIVTNYGFKLEFCKAENEKEARLLIREKYRKHYDFRIRSVEVSNRSLEEIEALD
ncbi:MULTISPECIES: hypothetical protein [unclassified Bacillus (in: firmicutes)]|uniref:hypothetical protein n=1 Tax=unclassified Bacillus (in: firmicutes) TaxID=185979 RepID=UPI000894DCC8|nr:MULTISPECIES: hypothetical protein [unclassified Bacillus (in: firmicutes)]SDY37863.1 hypothetical protein SAMN04488156_10190 [Bacillus sp. 166amftsu]SFI26919.1 hypothetical protein SAMN04488574_102173 [Bacillus sp. 71mf]SFS40243.1 hypothetical protein SAMN04488145_101293 [Bacillus sp. 103mf]